MDTKKTNLTPELKEIYDRVMNTSGSKAAATPGTTPPLATSATPPAGQSPLGTPSMPPPLGTTPPPAMPAAPAAPNPLGGTMPPPLTMPPASPPVGDPATGSLPPAGMPPVNSPQLPPMNGMPTMESTAEQALSSAPARPISEGNTFAFSGTAHQPPASPTVPGTATPAAGAKKKSKISLPVLIVLGLVFIIVWGLFWAIIFGFIKR